MRIAIIGLGHRGKKFLSAVMHCKEAKLVAVCDPVIQNHKSLITDKNVNLYTEVTDMVAKEKIDIAIVAVPHDHYLLIISILANHKIHIIKEKPFAISEREAKQLHEVIRANDVNMMIAVQRRFDKHYQVFKRMIKSVGPISHIRGSYTLNIDRLDEGWRANQHNAGGGVLSDMGYHFVDLLIWFFGLPADISCANTQGSKANQNYNVEDSTFLNFEYMNKAEDTNKKTIGSLFLSRVSIDPSEEITVQGQNGCIKLTPETITFYDIHNRPQEVHNKQLIGNWNPLVEMIEHFVHYLKGDTLELIADYRTHFDHTRFIELAYRADREYRQHHLNTIKQKMLLLSPPAQRTFKRDREAVMIEPDNYKKPAAEVEPDFIWPIITEVTKQRMLAQMTADNISCYNCSGVIEQFERNFARYHGRKFAMSTNSGTSAIHALYSSLQLSLGDEVLVPSNTFHATISPLMQTGAIPRFVDCLQNGNVDPEDMRRKISPKTKAVMVTHMWGIPCEMDSIVSLCREKNLLLLEDCSHAHGARYKGKLVGTFGLAAAWSFNGPKIISGGEGGMILTDDKEIEIRCNLVGQYNNRAMQIIPKDHHLQKIALTGFGLKHRITTIAAAMADEQLEHLDEWLNYKRLYANLFRSALARIPFIILADTTNTEPAWYAFTFYFDEERAGVTRDEFVKLLHAKGLREIKTPGSTCPQNNLELYQHPSQYLPQLYSGDRVILDHCPMSEKLYNQCIKMPMWAQSCDLKIVNKYIHGILEVALELSNSCEENVNKQYSMN